MSQSIRVSNGVTNWNVSFADPGLVYHMYEVCTTVDSTLVSTTGFKTFRCIYGYSFDPSRTQNFLYSVNVTISGVTTNTTMTAPMTGTYSTGADAATALQTALQTAENARSGGKVVDITVSYSEGTNFFTISFTQVRGTVNSFSVIGTHGGTNAYQDSATSHFGWQHGGTKTTSGSSGTVVSDYVSKAARVQVTFSGLGGSNRLSDAVNWNARALLGFSAAMTSDVTIKASMGDTDVAEFTDNTPPPVQPVGTWKPEPFIGPGPKLRGAYAVVSKLFWGLGNEVRPSYRPSVVSSDPPHGVTGAQVGPTTILRPGPRIASGYGPNEPTLNAMKHNMVRPEEV
jgi:hypothetical protein